MRAAGVMARNGANNSFPARLGQFGVRYRKPSAAQISDSHRGGARYVPHFLEDRRIAVELVMAGGIGFEIADVATQTGVDPSIDQAHPVQPSTKRLCHFRHAARITV